MPLRRAFEICAVLIAGAVLALLLLRAQTLNGMALGDGQPFFGDFIAFWSAGRAVLEGHADQVHDRTLLWGYQQAVDAGILFYAPWNSPPTFLLIVTPLALLPYPVAAILFLLATGVFFFIVARKLLPDARALIFAVTLPAVVFHLGTVQAALLTAGISGLALFWLDKRPLAAGALVSLLAIKPHLAILWPLFLAFSGRWRAFAAASIGTLIFAGVSVLVFGPDSYVRFFENLHASQDLVSGQRITTPAYASLFANLLDLGAPSALALAAHAVSAIAALALAVWIFRRGDRIASGAALCAATMLLSTYLFFYDSLLLAIGAALLAPARDRFEIVAMAAAWCAGLSLTLGYYLPLPIAPLAAWLILLAAWRRSGRAAAHPTQRTEDPPRSARSSPHAEA